jgi:hypothetical protein
MLLVGLVLMTLMGALPAPAAEQAPPPAPPKTDVSGWSAKRFFDPFRNETRCVLETPKFAFNDGRQDTTVFLRIDGKSLTVISESNVDIAKPDVGILVDGHKLIKPDSVFLDQQLLFESQIAQILAQFKAGMVVEAQLHFWPTWPSTGMKQVSFSLIGFTRNFARLPGC